MFLLSDTDGKGGIDFAVNSKDVSTLHGSNLFVNEELVFQVNLYGL